MRAQDAIHTLSSVDVLKQRHARHSSVREDSYTTKSFLWSHHAVQTSDSVASRDGNVLDRIAELQPGPNLNFTPRQLPGIDNPKSD